MSQMHAAMWMCDDTPVTNNARSSGDDSIENESYYDSYDDRSLTREDTSM